LELENNYKRSINELKIHRARRVEKDRTDIEKFKAQVSDYASRGIPFLFIIDYECQEPLLYTLDEAEKHGVYYSLKDQSNTSKVPINKKVQLQGYPIDKSIFAEKFDEAVRHINEGDSYLLNLTFPTKIDLNLDLKEIYHLAQAPYKLLVKDKFVVFSPECFIKILGDNIYTYPMKGTIDATLDAAQDKLMDNKKEMWEHNTIVDLLRNDLSMISHKVSVEKFRYVEKIKTHKGELLQTSTEIKGQLAKDWKENLGEYILKLLPAGSITGAPKNKTVEIINKLEIESRGYYTGVFGIFNGENLDSAISIRFIKQTEDGLVFNSGGGLTAHSDLDQEYDELIQKVYVPTS